MNDRPNPYIGPRPYTVHDILPAREREVLDLRRALMSARILLLHSPSGAGKTSLIEAQNGLRNDMKKRGFLVRPTARVGQALPSELADVLNRYEFSVLRSLSEGEPYMRMRLASTNLIDWLTDHPTSHEERAATSAHQSPRRRELLIFDQFEEILTSDPTDDKGRSEFFECLATVLADPYRWALFIIREDYLGALDPWARRLPTLLASRFRMDLLGVDAAREAIRAPAAAQHVQFDDAALEHLVTELRQTSVQQLDGTMERRSGIWIEPVQLQVVCRRLWSHLDTDSMCVKITEVEKLGNVDTALAGFYSEQIHQISLASGVPERVIREWVGTKLISRQGVRTPVMRGPASSDGLSNQVIDALESAHMIRGEERRGIKWYELSHDRLVTPILRNNARWDQANLHFVQVQADHWDRQGKPDELLLGKEPLEIAADWASSRLSKLTPIEKLYLTRSQERNTAKAKEQAKEQAASVHLAEAEARRLRQFRIGTLALSIALLCAIASTIYAWMLSRRAAHSDHAYKRTIVVSVLEPLHSSAVRRLDMFRRIFKSHHSMEHADWQSGYDDLRFYLMLTGPKTGGEPALAASISSEIEPRITINKTPEIDRADRVAVSEVAASFLVMSQTDTELMLRRNDSIVKNTRHILLSESGRVAELEALISRIGERNSLPPITMQTLSSSPVTRMRNDSIPGIYTQYGWDLLRDALATSAADGWVTGIDNNPRSASQHRRVRELRTLYFSRYISNWQSLIYAMRIVSPSDLVEAKTIFAELGRASSHPLDGLYQTLHHQLFLRDDLEYDAEINDVTTSSGSELRAHDLAKNFGPLLNFISPSALGQNRIAPLDRYRESIRSIPDLLSIPLDFNRKGSLITQIEVAIRETESMIGESELGKWSSTAEILLITPLKQLLDLLPPDATPPQ